MIKRFLLFAGDTYYPNGGWGDFIASFETKEDAIEAERMARARNSWSHLIDLENPPKSNDEVWTAWT